MIVHRYPDRIDPSTGDTKWDEVSWWQMMWNAVEKKRL